MDETPDANLSKGVGELNGVYTQRFNRVHGHVGHVFQAQFKAILVDKDNYRLELARYVVLNPLRVKIVRRLELWPVYLGSEDFVARMQKLVEMKPSLSEIPRAQRRAQARSLAEYADAHPRNEAIALAYLSGQHTMAAIAAHFDVHYTTVSRLVKAYETALR